MAERGTQIFTHIPWGHSTLLLPPFKGNPEHPEVDI